MVLSLSPTTLFPEDGLYSRHTDSLNHRLQLGTLVVCIERRAALISTKKLRNKIYVEICCTSPSANMQEPEK